MFTTAWQLWPSRYRCKQRFAKSAWYRAAMELQFENDWKIEEAENHLLSKVRQYVTSQKARSQYCGHMDKWLDAGCYDDHPDSWKIQTERQRDTEQRSKEYIDQWKRDGNVRRY